MQGGEDASFAAEDGTLVPGTWFHPSADRDEGRVVIVSTATGAPQRFYAPFAQYLAEQGSTVLTYDFRGMGRARPERMRGFEVTFLDWLSDAEGAIRAARERCPDHRLMLVGHSIGGMLPMMAESVVHVERIVTIGTQTAWWKDWPLRSRYSMFFLWHVLMPLVTSVVGYFPARRLNLGEDLPKGLAMAWARRWRSDTFAGFPPEPDRLIRRVRAEVLAMSMTDDSFGTPAALRRLHEELSVPVDYRFLDPQDFGFEKVGHFGFFHLRYRALWAEVGDALKRPARDVPVLGLLTSREAPSDE